jgi:agmatine deiminase
LLSRGRNAYRDKFQAETMLQDHLGAERTIWLDHGELLGDDTDAHVDTLARFLDPKTIAYVGPPTDPTDPHFESLSAMRAELRQLASGYDLLELPFAEPVYSTDDGHRLPATYANFLISNGYLFVPTYGLRTDAAALDLLRGRTSYTVVPVPGRPLIEQHGSLHCLCMQIPAIPPL